MTNRNKRGGELRRVTEDELKKLLLDHFMWLETNGREGEKADLSYLDISNCRLDYLEFFEIDLTGSNLSNSQFRECIFYKSNLSRTNLSDSNFSSATFEKVNLENANFTNANLENVEFISTSLEKTILKDANFDSTKIDKHSKINKLTSKQLMSVKFSSSGNTEAETKFDIQELKKQLEEQKRQFAAAQEGEKYRIKAATKRIEDKLEETEAILEKERKAKESTNESIEAGIGHLKAPNNYLQSQINIQYWLTRIYGALAILTIVFLFYYIGTHYSEFKADLTKETTFLQWLFYALPIAVCFSLILTFINQVNSRLKNVIVLHEKKRYVDSISGGLKAVQELSENNKDARLRISGVLDEILNNTITLSEKLQEDVLPNEKSIDNKVSVSLKELKDLFSK